MSSSPGVKDQLKKGEKLSSLSVKGKEADGNQAADNKQAGKRPPNPKIEKQRPGEGIGAASISNRKLKAAQTVLITVKREDLNE